MKGTTLIKLLIAFHLCFSAKGQNSFQYTPLCSTGPIPEDFRILSSEKFNREKTNIEKKAGRSVRKAKERFYLKSNYYIDELLLSGKVLFNDPVSLYAKKVLDKVLADDSGLADSIRIYTVKSTVVNAYTTGNGIILVTTGLIAQLENEAQLAYILSHEIIHFKNKHAVNAFIENEQIEKGTGGYKKISRNDRILAKSAYSKELETESDEQGLDLYLKTNYSTEVLSGVFDVLQYSYLPFDDVPFEQEIFETPYMHFPKEYYLEELIEITGEEDYDDSNSSHPNILKRRSKIASRIENINSEGKQKFIVSEDDFYRIRETARFELGKLYLSALDYGNAIYNTFLLMKNHPGNIFLEKTMAKSLYGIAKYKNFSSGGVVIKNYDKIEGQSQQLFHLLKKIKPQEFNSFALSYIWKLSQKYPDEKLFLDLSSDLLNDLVYEHQLKPTDFFKKPKEIKQEEPDSEKKELSKYEKIKKKKEKEQAEGDESYFKYSFVEIFQDSKFISSFEKISDKFETEKETGQKLKDEEARKKEKRQEKENKLIAKKGYALGIDKIVIAHPYYKVVDQRKKDAIQFIDSESSQREFSEKLVSNANLTGIDAVILDPKNLKTEDASKFNDLSVLSDWISEKVAHEELKVQVSLNDEIKNMASLYGTKYFAWAGIVSTREKNLNAAYYACLACMVPYLLPFALIYALTPRYDTMYYMVLFDVETSEVVLNDKYYFKYRDRDDILNSYMYNSLFQIKNKRTAK